MLIVFLVARQSFKKYLYGTFTFSRTELKRDFLVENSAKLNSQVLQPPHSHPESMTFVSNNRPQLVKRHKSYFQVSKKYFINLAQKLQPWEKKTSMKSPIFWNLIPFQWWAWTWTLLQLLLNDHYAEHLPVVRLMSMSEI